MSRPVPPEAWQQILRQAGPQQAAVWARDSGYDVPDGYDDEEELPPVEADPMAGYGSPLSVGLPRPAPISPSALDAAAKGAIPSAPTNDFGALMDAQRKSVADMYDEAARALQETYRGPSTNDALLALGAGLLAPTSSGSFTEALSTGLSSMLPVLRQKHTSRNEMNMELAKLRMGKARDIADLQTKYLVAQMKAPRARRVASRQGTGDLFFTDSGMPVPPPDRIDAMLAHRNDPMAAEAFDRTYGPGAAQYVIETYGGQ